ncbi:MAG: ABC-F family ATP-binding cassette domain-containing protein, partial [Firmicutes bacterium]|nr:ABC-F family ATP-binding cassette domain-containing protein [Bacillota bacterium]
MIVLSAKDLTKTYGIDVILQDVSFHVNEGDRIGIIGANGAGKTTLLRMLSGELPYDSGEFYMSQDTTIGYLKQSDNFQSENTVIEE